MVSFPRWPYVGSVVLLFLVMASTGGRAQSDDDSAYKHLTDSDLRRMLRRERGVGNFDDDTPREELVRLALSTEDHTVPARHDGNGHVVKGLLCVG